MNREEGLLLLLLRFEIDKTLGTFIVQISIFIDWKPSFKRLVYTIRLKKAKTPSLARFKV